MPPRDLSIVNFVGLLRQVSTPQIKVSLFAERTQTPLDRSLKRLVAGRFLSRVGRRHSHESLGGIGPYVYQLGPKGWALLGKRGRYWPYRSVNDHMLCVGDVFVGLIAAERQGLLKLLRYSLEQPVGEAQADLYVELDTGQPEPDGYFLEIDLGTERPSRIREKCAAYWRAYDNSTAPTFPYVVFVVPDKWRYDELGRILRRLPDKQQPLFKVFQFKELLDVLTSVSYPQEQI
jgi:hypothetical protein